MSPEAMREAVAVSLGWVRCRTPLQAKYDPEPHGWRSPKGAIKSNLPDYPGDIKAAWGLLEVLRRDGYSIKLESVGIDDWRVSVMPYGTRVRLASVVDSMPIAICEAYLKAKGLWKEGE